MQQQSAATAATSSDLSRPAKTSDLHQRPSTTSMRLVHTEEVIGRSSLQSNAPTPSQGWYVPVDVLVSKKWGYQCIFHARAKALWRISFPLKYISASSRRW